jgi:hypothetical protein
MKPGGYSPKPVIQMNLLGTPIKEFASIALAAKAIGLNTYTAISNVCSGLTHTSCGFKWR